MKFCCSILNSNRNCPGFFEVVHCFVLYWGGSLRASSPIWASEASLARTRERGAEERRTKQGALHKRIQLIKGFHFPSTRTENSVRNILFARTKSNEPPRLLWGLKQVVGTNLIPLRTKLDTLTKEVPAWPVINQLCFPERHFSANGISLRLGEVRMKIYERSLQALLSSAPRGEL